MTSITIALILVAGILCQWLAWRVKLPAIIFLLSCGVLAGPVLGWLDPDLLMGELLFPFVSLSVAVILFEGSLTLKLREIPGLEKVIRNMITLGALITWAITATATALLLGFAWEIACLFGAIMVVTGPTVVMPMLRTVRPRESVANILQWESILIDPIGAILAVLVYQFIVAGGAQGGVAAGALVFGKIVLIGVGLGAGGGYLFGLLLRKYWVPQFLHNIIALALVCGVFALSNLLEAESGLLTVTVMGVWLANMKGVDLDEIMDFKESLSLLLISVLFILLAARMDLSAFLALGWPALGVFLVIQFLARPLSVQASALGSGLSMAERHLLSWIAPRGIVAAAITAVFAMKLGALGYEDAPQLVPLTFMVIIGTVLLQSTTARFIASRLGVAEPEPRGFLIVGANPVAQAVGLALQENGYRVLLADQNWSAVRDAKLAGLPAYWGNPVSEHAERNLNLVGIGHLLALSANVELNALAAQYYRLEFEPMRIFSVRNWPRKDGVAVEKSAFRYGGRVLFDDEVAYRDLKRMFRQGGEIRRTALTREFTFADYLADASTHRLPLFAIDGDEGIHVFTPDADFTPREGWSILALTREADRADSDGEEKT
ncbi:cation:proton antiporter [Pseudodesulfovibrio pelocollis]|uniref:cation:proton antiporter n=1 Tax=Pseudodesulfovibrio pelocollis TaxID=3051432 RepID=UPI00255AA4E1|nr:sodium:proton antiporter [Pseudodesulfovibrio sp. SB368]